MDAWAHIFDKYGRDTSNEADEVDVFSGAIVVDRGHYRTTPARPFGRMLDGAYSDSDSGSDNDDDNDEEEEEELQQQPQSSDTSSSTSNPNLLSEIARKQKLFLAVPKLTLEALDTEMMLLVPSTPSSTLESTPSSRDAHSSVALHFSTPTHRHSNASAVEDAFYTPILASSVSDEIQFKTPTAPTTTPTTASQKPSSIIASISLARSVSSPSVTSLRKSVMSKSV
ncbi:UNVERIFIED_CONTAM: hypothetical protein HDU68_001269, partial [Siphonaria sp. JEL0065]